MTFARLIRANIFRNKKRTFLTVASVAVAFFLFGTLQSVVTTLDAASNVGSASRMIVTSATGFTFPLPEAHIARLSATPGVKSVSWANWFGGYYQEPTDNFAQFAIDAESYLPMYPEIAITGGSDEEFKQDMTGALVGSDVMEKFGWKLGQKVVLHGQIYPGDWEFNVRAIYTSSSAAMNNGSMFFHYKYLFEKGGPRVSPGWFILDLNDAAAAPTIAAQVDTLFKNSSAPTKTATEKAFQASFMTMMGNVRLLMRAIGTSVFFAILFVSANTMMMAARERIGEIAILKTLGFSNRRLSVMIILESTIITLFGGALGVLLAKWAFSGKNVVSDNFPGFGVTTETVMFGLSLAFVLGLVSGLVPAWQSARLSVVDAIRHVA